MKTLTNSRQDIRESERETSADASFTSRFVTRNLRALDTALKAARVSLRCGKNIAIRTQAEFHKEVSAKRGA